ncbi:type II toxin-antitoxin system Phd/YefM family antitoxin [Kalamiella sp. sgz302252]|uniref:type II toxin-antitoxin system Phd/YefM family antitoxin n=1 Tax=Pantoea sp. sgz302252 TaxID=3341827 RepID=UPI0036D2B62E
MQKMNLYEAKTHFSKVITQVAETGEAYLITRNSKPMAKIVPLTAQEKTPRIGFMQGKITAPDNFNQLSSDEIADLFYGE